MNVLRRSTSKRNFSELSEKEDINGNILHVMVLIGSAGKTFGITGAKVIFFF
jgi:hypothetical protein